MVECPKCKSKSVYCDSTIGEKRTTCVSCGFSHNLGAARQSMERQITGKNLIYGIGDLKAQLSTALGIDDSIEHFVPQNLINAIENAPRKRTYARKYR